MSIGQHLPAPAPGPDPAGLPHVLVLSQVQVEQLGMVFSVADSALSYFGDCTACSESPTDLCGDHAADLDRAWEFRRLARDCGIGVPSS